MTTVYLVRHGLVENPGAIYYGRLPGFALAAAGREQAAAAGRHLAGRPVVAIYHSPMQRAAETAAILRDHHPASPPLVESALLNEIYSPFDGTPVAEMERRDWDLYSGVGPPYELPPDIQARMVAFFDAVRAAHPMQHVVGVSHGDPILFALCWGLGRPIAKDQRQFLAEWGIADGYPFQASVATFTWSDASQQRPDCAYHVATKIV